MSSAVLHVSLHSRCAGAAAAAGPPPHAIPHAVFSAPVLDAHPRKQLAHAGADPIIPITADVGSAAVTTDMSCCCVHGPACVAIATGEGEGAAATAGPHAVPHAVFSAPVFDAHPRKQLAHAGNVPIIPITTATAFGAVATDTSCCCVHGPAVATGAFVGLLVATGASSDCVSPMSATSEQQSLGVGRRHVPWQRRSRICLMGKDLQREMHCH